MKEDNTYKFAEEHENNDTNYLLLHSSLYPEIDMSIAVRQIMSIRKVKDKIPTWYKTRNIHYPSTIAAEQCSSELTAKYKASLIEGNTLSDLTGGLGIDSWAFSSRVQHVNYYERFPEYCQAAKHNFNILGIKNITINNCDFRTVIESIAADTIYIDPARRGTCNKRVFAISECEPNVLELKNELLSRCKRLIIKLSPMVDLTELHRAFPEIFEIHIISVKNDCKEILAIATNQLCQNFKISAINIDTDNNRRGFTYFKEDEDKAQPNIGTSVGKFLYEPFSSVMKSGGFKIISSIFNVSQLQQESHLYTSNELIESFPGRIFRVTDIVEFSSKWTKKAKEQFPQANIAIRNFPMSVAELRKRTKIQEGGEIYLFATTIHPNKKIIISCVK